MPSIKNGRIKLKIDTTANWADSTLVILEGEMAIEVTDSGFNKIKIGNGSDVFADLEYANYSQDEINNFIITETSYTNDEEMPVAVGGLAAGTTFDNMTLETLLGKLLYPYTAPIINSFKIQLNGGTATTSGSTREIGNPLTSITYITSVTKKSDIPQTIKSYQTSSSVVITTDISTLDWSSNKTQTITETYTPSSSINSTCALKTVVNDGTTDVSSSTITINFVRPMYIGYVDGSVTSSTLTESDITGSTMSKLVAVKANKSLASTFSAGRFLFAYPASYGDLKSILDPNNFEYLSDFTKVSINVTCLDGTSVAYYAYLYNNICDADAFNMTYKFS